MKVVKSSDYVTDNLGFGAGELTRSMGIEIIELAADRSRARMPSAGNTQASGRVHGGAYAVLAESVASLSAAMHAGDGKIALGTELSASHVGGVSNGYVHADCRALSLGRRLTVHQVELTDDDGKLVSVIRVTNYISSRKAVS
ncbi:PaaI family thioesterase [Rhodococcus koreensis]